MEPLDPVRHGLPHREPFIFIDKVIAREPGLSATCQKFFSASEPFFRGHFPGRPLVPGVILTEAAAQTAGVAAGGDRGYHLSAIRQMKFTRPVGPDSLVEFHAVKTAGMAGLLQFQVTAKCAGAVVAEGMIVLNEV